MIVRDTEVARLIEHLGEHFRGNISNRFIRPALLHLTLDSQSWELLERLTETNEEYQYQGYHLVDLYNQILAAGRFVSLARTELSTSLRIRLGAVGRSDPDRVLRDMAVNNFQSNLRVFADLLNELYLKLVALDKEEAKGKQPVYAKLPELQELGLLLIE